MADDPVESAPAGSPSPRPKQGGRSRPRRLGVRLIRVVLLAYLAWVFGLYLLQDRLLFPASFARGTAQKPDEVEVWTVSTPAGDTVEAWYWPAKASGSLGQESDGVASSGIAPAVIFCHGNAELLDNGLGQAEMYREMGYAVLLPEYRGYGNSGGKPSERGITEDLVRFRDRLAEQPGIDPDRIIYHGRSIGGGFACALANERPPAGLVLESTFTSVASFSWKYGIPPLLCRNPMRNDKVIARLDCPVLLLHGRQDALVWCGHSEKLASLSHRPTLAIGEGGHNDFPRDWNWYEAEIRSFLRGVEPAR